MGGVVDGVLSRTPRRGLAELRQILSLVILVTMRKTSLADAKARLSAIVDDAEHRRRKTVILRHGRPSAVIVPVESAKAATAPRLSGKEIAALFEALAVGQKRSAVRDLLKSRR